MGCLGILLGPFSGLTRGGVFFVAQIIAFLIATAIVPVLFWVWWLGCGVWTVAMFDSDKKELEAQAMRLREDGLRGRVAKLESKLDEHGIK